MKIILVFSLAFLLFSCGEKNKKIVLEKELPKHLSSQHFEYYMSNDDNFDTVFQEKFYNWVMLKLKIDISEGKDADSINKEKYVDWIKAKMRKDLPEGERFNANQEKYFEWVRTNLFKILPNGKIDTMLQNDYNDWLKRKLVDDSKDKIIIYKFKNRQHMKKLIGIEINGFTDCKDNKLYCVWNRDNHECVHLIVFKYIGDPRAFFNEGIAVAHQAEIVDSELIPFLNKIDYNLIAKYYSENKKLPALDSLLVLYSLLNKNEVMNYILAGSFVNYLIDKYGIEKIKDFFTISHYDDNPKVVDNNFSSVYNSSVYDVWAGWKEFLYNYKDTINYDRYFEDYMNYLNKSRKGSNK